MDVLIDVGNGSVAAVRPGVRQRLHARVAARRIDRELANGVSPDADAVIALHALRLSGMRERRRLAAGLQHAWQVAAQPPALTSVVVDRDAVAGAQPEILQLTAQLLAPGPLSVRGIAFVRTLLTSGTGPMYALVPGRSLGAALRHAVELLAIDSEATAR